MKSIGTDIVELERIKRSHARFGEQFLAQILSTREQELIKNTKGFINFLAGRFAAKEAIYKALGTEIGFGVAWKEMEVLREASGKPYVELSGKAKARAEELGIHQIHISISHCKSYAIAFVCFE